MDLKRQKFYLICLTILNMQVVFAQDQVYNLSLRSPNVLILESSIATDSNKRIGAAINYTIVYQDEAIWSGYHPFGIKHDLFRSSIRSGIGGAVFFEYQSKRRPLNTKRISLEYRHLKSGNYIDDHGYGSGSNTSDYYEFKDTYNNIGLIYSIYRKLIAGSANYFVDFGIDFRSIQRRYSIEGGYNDQRPSNRIERINRIDPLIRLGLQFNLY